MKTALEKFTPDAEKNFAALKSDLETLDARLIAVGKRLTNAPLVASHPVYHYFARRYALNLQAVLWEPETVPDDKAMEELKAILAKHPAKWMIWEDEPNPKAVEKLKALGISSVVFKPSGNKPEEGDFLTQMRKNIESIKPAFAP